MVTTTTNTPTKQPGKIPAKGKPAKPAPFPPKPSKGGKK